MNSIILPLTIFQPQQMDSEIDIASWTLSSLHFRPNLSCFLPQIYSGIGISFCAAYSSILRVSSALYVHLCAEIVASLAMRQCTHSQMAAILNHKLERDAQTVTLLLYWMFRAECWKFVLIFYRNSKCYFQWKTIDYVIFNEKPMRTFSSTLYIHISWNRIYAGRLRRRLIANYTRADEPVGIIGVIRVNEGRNIWEYKWYDFVFTVLRTTF
jgi:hypothetical protein